MKSLLQLLIRFNAISLFFVLQAICFLLIIHFNEKQSAIYTATKDILFEIMVDMLGLLF